jgi:isoleucyl-tRNA synthetase
MPAQAGKEDSVMLAEFPEQLGNWRDTALEERYAGVWQIRDIVLKSLEESRRTKVIGHPREARVILSVDAAAAKALGAVNEDLARLFLVRELELERDKPAVSVEIAVAPGQKCARCWVHSRAVGKSARYPDLCDRCEEALGGLSKDESSGPSQALGKPS